MKHASVMTDLEKISDLNSEQEMSDSELEYSREENISFLTNQSIISYVDEGVHKNPYISKTDSMKSKKKFEELSKMKSSVSSQSHNSSTLYSTFNSSESLIKINEEQKLQNYLNRKSELHKKYDNLLKVLENEELIEFRNYSMKSQISESELREYYEETRNLILRQKLIEEADLLEEFKTTINLV